ncbi:MAG: DUF2330 domain-containing protein [Myxococcota bacterium]
MRQLSTMAALAAVALAPLAAPAPAEACGGFFCGQQPVDQQAERILFAIDEAAGTTDMIVQIAYEGDADDFAWIVPLGQAPFDGSLDADFPQGALTALDANTSPQLWPNGGCFFLEADAGAGPPSGGRDDDGVTIIIEETVGPYDVVVLESEDPQRLVQWLRDNEFRVTDPMTPYIQEYTLDPGTDFKFLALKLTSGADTKDITPFKMTLPGTAPVVPLKMTALAAEPEMGIVVFILGGQRYEPANWESLEVPDDYIVWDFDRWTSNWPAAVARVVDESVTELGVPGFVTELATSTDTYLSLLMNTTPADEEQAAAVEALLEVMEGKQYITRLYSRLSAEEMLSDPLFRRSAGPDVERWREVMLPEIDEEDCFGGDAGPEAASPCAFIACGALGTCAEADVDGTTVAACACAAGATARTTFGPNGEVTVACQDQRMSFLNPGDVEIPGATPLSDPCVGFDCGFGTCVPMNMTPTCACDRGFVAVGSLVDGARSTRCVAPVEPVPTTFYQATVLPPRPTNLPAGRTVELPDAPSVGGAGGCSAAAGAGGLMPLLLLLAARRRRS